MTDSDFEKLLLRYEQNQCTPQEREIIERWLDAIPQGEAPFRSKRAQRKRRSADKHIIFERAGIPMQKQRTLVTYTRIAAAVGLLAAATVGIWLYNTSLNKPVSIISDIQPKSITPDLPVILTGQKFVELPDGSTVLLNKGSELTYESGFDGKDRIVSLKGEAYFDIAHNASKPFKVLTGDVVTTVLGTAFNVKAFPDQKNVTVTVTRGKVQVGDETRIYGLITPDQQIAVNTVDHTFVKMDTKAEHVTEWKDNYLILDKVTLAQAVEMIEAKYHTKIKFAKSELRDCRFSATFLNGESLEQVLGVVTTVTQTEFNNLENGTIELSGKGCQ